MGMLGLTLIFVGAVLFINGMGGLKRADDRSMAVFNFLAGFLFLFAALLSLVRADATQDYYGVAGILLFAFTYLYIAASLWFDLDLRGLGWYCFFVALTTIPYFTLNYQAGEYRLGTMWLAWGALWYMFYLAYVPGKNFGKALPYATIAIAIFTGWIPGLLMLTGNW
ncbi:MAG: AmiS/UreI transporter [Gammaproteobacteria bacterium]|nr:AmiS/UreI transporter [Gammaproteobacteria bacterium]MYH70866.1 AmiS/UreI transporter [Gammaproteobacteria bacterium]